MLRCRSSAERAKAGHEGWVLGLGWNSCRMQNMKHGDPKHNIKVA